MQGVVSLLDDEHYKRIEDVWEELSRTFGVRGIYATPFPHFTYQVSEVYDPARVQAALHKIAAGTEPFSVRTGGLGVFTAAKPVLYMPIVRSPALERLHAAVWQQLGDAPQGCAARYYEPDMWLPHVTLAHGDIDSDRLAEIVRLLSRRNFHWEIEVNNLSYIYDTGTEQGLRCRFNFGHAKKAVSD
jgi:2'-5' RNA ligase